VKASVVAVGDANVDLIAPVESLPDRGGEVSTDKLHKCAGGSAANLCVAPARLGLGSRFIGRVGDDPLRPHEGFSSPRLSGNGLFAFPLWFSIWR